MKKLYLLFVLALIVVRVSAEEKKAILYYDYTSPAIMQGGKFQPPEMVGEIEMITEKDASIKLDAKKNYLKVKGGDKITLKNGGTLFAVVKFLDSNTNIKISPTGSLDMIFFKNYDFLLGRYGKSFYFNMASNKKWPAAVYSKLPSNLKEIKWLRLGVTVSKQNDKYTICMYINGKKTKSKTFENLEYTGSSQSLTIGKGWGGSWMMHGQIAQLKIYDVPLSESEMAALDKKAPYKK